MPSGEARAGSYRQRGIELLNRVDNWSDIRNEFRAIAKSRDEWAGIPVPVGKEIPLIIEPSYPFAGIFNEIEREEKEPDSSLKLRNTFYSHHRKSTIYAMETSEGRVVYGLVPRVHGLTIQMNTLGASVAWGIEQEANAVQTLARLLNHYQFKCYMLTGSFLESSKRTGLTYMFRKLRPTVVIDTGGKHWSWRKREVGHHEGETFIRCCLCLHPIGYYEYSWAGAMCPTDDVLAHLMLMRGDEPLFWRRCNQHPPGMPEGGL